MSEQPFGPVVDPSGRTLDQIRLLGLEAVGHHGVLDHERRDGQTFRADVVVHLDTRAAAGADALDRTVDYGVLAERVVAVLAGPAADLIETVAERIAAVGLAWPIVAVVDVALHKPGAPITVPFGDVVVAVRRDRLTPPVVPAAAADTPAFAVVTAPVHEPAAIALVGVGAPPAGPVEVEPPAADEPPADEPLDEVPADDEPLDGEPPADEPLDGELPHDEPQDGELPDDELPDDELPDDELPDDEPDAHEPILDEPQDEEPQDVSAGADAPESYRPPTSLPWGPSTAGLPLPGGIFAAATSVLPVVTDPVLAVPAMVPDDDDPAPEPPAPRELDRLDQAPDGPVDVVLAIGSNVGASQETLRRSVSELDAIDGLEVTAVSPLARTAAVGGPEQADYLNAVVLARTTLAPRELLHATQALEAAHGRVRAERWGPRTLDVDLVVYGSVLAVTDDLELPHPRAHERAFVLQPWAQVDPDAVLPGLGGGPVGALAATAPDREGLRWIALDWLAVPGAR